LCEYASTINIDDIHIAEETFYGDVPIGGHPAPNRPVTPGSDLAVIVVSIGKGVRSLRVGQAVFGVPMPYRPRGAWEEFCAVDERWLTPKPGQLTFTTAAACGISGLVAFAAIGALELPTGLRVVIAGASGGIGGVAVQLAVRSGPLAIGVCGPAHAATAYQMGCPLVLDYDGEPWDRKLTAGGPARIDRVLDRVGGRDVEEAAGVCLAPMASSLRPLARSASSEIARSAGLVFSPSLRASAIASSARIRRPRYSLAGPTNGTALADVARAAVAGVLSPRFDRAWRLVPQPLDSERPISPEPPRVAV